MQGATKLPALDKFNISYFGPIANYQTHQRYQSRGDALYGDGVHSDLPVYKDFSFMSFSAYLKKENFI